MDNIIKAFVGFFFMFAMMFASLSIINATISSRNAEAYANNAATKIEEANYSNDVINEVIEDAENYGYTLTVDVETSATDNTTHFGLLTMKYSFSIPMFNIKQSHIVAVDLL